MNRFVKLAWLTVGATVFVILWGALVRATGSGAGCGNHWPSCNGEVLPLSGTPETMIELTHRLTSAGLGFLVLYLFLQARRRYPPGGLVRKATGASLVLVATEALVGAGLVLYEQTADADGLSRAFWNSGHLVNTFLLLGAVTLTAWWASTSRVERQLATQRERRLVGVTVGGMLLLGISGAIAALGDTLFPVDSFAEGLERELSATAHVFERLRVLHPVIAVVVGLLAVRVASRLASRRSGRVPRLSSWLTLLVVAQFGLGLINVVLAAPVWMQLIHLLVADAVWMTFVVISAEVLIPARSRVSV
jgi:heme A synthase